MSQKLCLDVLLLLHFLYTTGSCPTGGAIQSARSATMIVTCVILWLSPIQFSEQGIEVDIAQLEFEVLETVHSPHVPACERCTRQQYDCISFIWQPFSFPSALGFSRQIATNVRTT